jgi:hypothetical protein
MCCMLPSPTHKWSFSDVDLTLCQRYTSACGCVCCRRPTCTLNCSDCRKRPVAALELFEDFSPLFRPGQPQPSARIQVKGTWEGRHFLCCACCFGLRPDFRLLVITPAELAKDQTAAAYDDIDT